jgi:alpha-glucosidase (family GH31 glycosyl hydrolase)
MYYDPTNPEARQYVWDKVKANYYDLNFAPSIDLSS